MYHVTQINLWLTETGGMDVVAEVVLLSDVHGAMLHDRSLDRPPPSAAPSSHAGASLEVTRPHWHSRIRDRGIVGARARTRRGIRISYGTKERLASRGSLRAARPAPTVREIIRRLLPNPRERSERERSSAPVRSREKSRHWGTLPTRVARSFCNEKDTGLKRYVTVDSLTRIRVRGRRGARFGARSSTVSGDFFNAPRKRVRRDRGKSNTTRGRFEFSVKSPKSSYLDTTSPITVRLAERAASFCVERAQSLQLHANVTSIRSRSRDTPVTIELPRATGSNVQSRAPEKNGRRNRRREATASPERAVPRWSRFRGLLPLPHLPRVSTNTRKMRASRRLRVYCPAFRSRSDTPPLPLPLPTPHSRPPSTVRPRKRARTGPRIPVPVLSFARVVYLSLSGLRTARNRLRFS